jgi:copper transport protein
MGTPVLGTPVLAHAQLVASSPAAGAVLEASPDELRLVFSEPLESQVTSIDVATPEGEPVLERAGEVDPNDAFSLVVSDPQLPDGVYVVTWRTLSAADGHTAEGFFSFGIGEVSGDLPQAAGGAGHGETDPIAVVGRWLAYLGLLLALGMAAFHRFVIRDGAMPRDLVRLLAAGLALSGAASLVTAVAAGIEAGNLVDYLLASRNGALQAARVAVVGAGAVALLLVPPRLSGVVAAATGLGGIALLVSAGHASGVPGPAAVIGGIVHVAAVGIWAGGVAGVLLLILHPGWVMGGQAPTLRTVVPRFSAMALVAIGLVLVTGAYSAWVQTGALLPAGTEYGRTLVMKSALVLGALAMGGLNFLDGGRMRPWLDGFRTRVSVEMMAIVAVLVMSAALASTPPVDEATGTGIEPVPDAFGEVTPNMSMSVAPGRPGVNRLVVGTSAAMAAISDMELSLDRLDTGTTTRVPLVLEGMEGMDHSVDMDHSGLPTSPDGTVDWIADAVVLPAGSQWDTTVRVLSSDGVELLRQRFAFTLSESGIDEGREPGLLFAVLALAGLLAAGGALAIGLGLGGLTLPLTERLASRVALLTGGTVAVLLGVLIGIGRLVA